MKRQYFGDNKDLVKWAIIRKAAEALRPPATVFYVAMLTNDETPFVERHLSTGENIPDGVYDFFHDLERLQQFPWPSGTSFVSQMAPFVARDRRKYFEDAADSIRAIRDRCNGGILAFLDPDTGLRTGSQSGEKFALPSDLRTVFEALAPRDVLAVYQHKNKRDGEIDWIAMAAASLGEALQAPPDHVHALAGNISRDLVILLVEKPT